jgi:hypothetical protein
VDSDECVSQILGQIAGISSKGIAQRQGVMQENPLVSAVGTIAPIAGQIFGAMSNPFGHAPDASGGGLPQFGPLPGLANAGGGGPPGISAPGPITSMPSSGWTPTLFDYGIR